eukprot:g15402.t1
MLQESVGILQCFAFRMVPEPVLTLELLLEFAPLGDLCRRLRLCKEAVPDHGLPKAEVVAYTYDVAQGLSFLHGLRPKIFHRDVKPANIMLCYPESSVTRACPRAKLADFGVAKVMESEASTAGTATFIGTPHYLSPEVFSGDTYDERADAWALGCVLYEMMCFCRPFHFAETNVAIMALRISQGHYDRERLSQAMGRYPEGLLQTAEGLLRLELSERLRAIDLVESLGSFGFLDEARAESPLPSCWDPLPIDGAGTSSEVRLDTDSWHGAHVASDSSSTQLLAVLEASEIASSLWATADVKRLVGILMLIVENSVTRGSRRLCWPSPSEAQLKSSGRPVNYGEFRPRCLSGSEGLLASTASGKLGGATRAAGSSEPSGSPTAGFCANKCKVTTVRYLRETLEKVQQENLELKGVLQNQVQLELSPIAQDDPEPLEKKPDSAKRLPVLLRAPTPLVVDEELDLSSQSASQDKSGLLRDWRVYAAHALEFGPPIVIVLNSIAIALVSDVVADETTGHVVESIFAFIYLIEFLLKIKLLGCRGYFWGENWQWNWFDFLCLLCASLEFVAMLIQISGIQAAPFLDDVTVVRVFRLGQLMRTVRVLKFKMFRELRQITMGIMNGCEVLFWAVVLLFAVIYVFGVVMRNLVGGALDEFNNIPNSMFTLFRCFTDGCAAYDGAPLAERLRSMYGTPFTVGYVCVTMLVAIGIFNMIMAIFLENATTSAARRKQKELGEKAIATEQAIRKIIVQMVDPSVMERAGDRRSLASRMTQLFESRSSQRSRSRARSPSVGQSAEVFWRTQYELLKRSGVTVDRRSFMLWLEEPVFLSVLENAEVDVSNKFDLFDVLDADMGGRLELDEVVTGLMKLRGPVSKSDLVAMRLQVRLLTQQVIPG